jgi:hypothetical protein
LTTRYSRSPDTTVRIPLLFYDPILFRLTATINADFTLSQVRFVGLFPELVGQMMETTLDEASDEESTPEEDVVV